MHKVWIGTIGKDARSDYSDDLYECIGDLYVSVMTSQGDMNLCAHINTPSNTVWLFKYVRSHVDGPSSR